MHSSAFRPASSLFRLVSLSSEKAPEGESRARACISCCRRTIRVAARGSRPRNVRDVLQIGRTWGSTAPPALLQRTQNTVEISAHHGGTSIIEGRALCEELCCR